MLIGSYTVNLSQGRRVAIPFKFRKSLGKDPIIAKWYENCLVIVSKSDWESLLEKLTGTNNNLTGNVRDTDRFILGSAYELKLDSQGRIVIPDKLSKYANIVEEATFLGLGKRIELWDTKTWEKREKFIAEYAASLIERIAKNE